MRSKMILLLSSLLLLLVGCSVSNNTTTSSKNNTSTTISKNDSKIELLDFSSDIKKEEVINPGMGLYSTRYLSLKRESNMSSNNFSLNGFYHVRIDLSDFTLASNNVSDYEITKDALDTLDNYFSNAKLNKCSLIIRFAYDKFAGKSNMEPSLEIIKEHIISLSSVINNYKDTIIAVECGLIGPWGEMHTSTLANQDTYNELIDSWLYSVQSLPILLRRPKFIYSYLGYSIDNLEEFNAANVRLGMYNDGYYGTSLDTGTYESLDNRKKETKFLAKLGNLSGGELIGEPTDLFTYDEIINEMNLINLTYLNSEWKSDIIQSWKEKEYNNQSFYTYMINHMGFKLYVDDFNYSIDNDEISVDINLNNMGFSNITRDLKAQLIFDIDGKIVSIKKDISNSNLNINLSTGIIDNIKVYLKIIDNQERSYELMNGSFENDMNYLGVINIK